MAYKPKKEGGLTTKYNKDAKNTLEHSANTKKKELLAKASAFLGAGAISLVQTAAFHLFVVEPFLDKNLPTPPASVDTVFNEHTEQARGEHFKDNRYFLFARGFGRESSGDMAKNAQAVTDQYGHTTHLIYDQRNVDKDEIREAIEKEYHLDTVPDREIELHVFAQSAGGKIALPAILDLLDKHPGIAVKTIILDAAPYDEQDVREGVSKEVINFAKNSPLADHLGRTAIIIPEMYSQSKTFGVPLYSTATFKEASRTADNMRFCGLVGQGRAIASSISRDTLSSLTNDDGSKPEIVYLGSSNPDLDDYVYVKPASQKWKEFFGGYVESYTIIPINNSGHAQLSHGNQNEVYHKAMISTYTELFEPTPTIFGSKKEPI